MTDKETRDRGQTARGTVTIRKPTAEDGFAVHNLIADCPPLDRNSFYFDLIQCSHYADTAAIAEVDGEIAGFVSGHIPPAKPDTLFIWQVAVGEKARGLGLASRMILEIAARPENAALRKIEATITPDNEASWALFKGLAKKLSTTYTTEERFDRDRHFHGKHDSEEAIVIGDYAEGAPREALAKKKR